MINTILNRAFFTVYLVHLCMLRYHKQHVGWAELAKPNNQAVLNNSIVGLHCVQRQPTVGYSGSMYKGNIQQANYPRLLGIFVSGISNKANVLWFWSSSPIANIPFYAWYISFYYGDDFDYGRDSGYRVRLVRSGQ